MDVNLRRQIYALEESEILPAEAITREPPTSLAVASAAHPNSPNASLSRTGGGSKGPITGGGLGNLDVGWLNSRNDNVGKEKKAELWREAERFMSKLEGRNPGADRELGFLKGDGEKRSADASQELDGSGRQE